MSRFLVKAALCCAAALLVGGCGSSQRMSPTMGYGDLSVQAQVDRSDMVVLDSVEGTSSKTSIAFGIVEVVDGDKLSIVGIPLFKNKYTYYGQPGLLGEVSTTDRAYYAALEKSPDADVVLARSMEREDGGIPLLWQIETVTFKGKALRLKADQ